MACKHLKLREKNNTDCLRCNKETRSKNTNEGICNKIVSAIDGLPVRCVGRWADEKIYRLTQYFGIFATGMKNKWRGNLNYIEICAGPGRCVLKEDGKELDGTALAIINHPSFKYIKNAIFIDYNKEVVNALNKRIDLLNKSEYAKAIECDYKKIDGIKLILSDIPKNCLNLVLLDPTDCSIPFSLIMTIENSLKNVDFIINIAFGTDLKRKNLRNAILNPNHYKSKIKYCNFLGSKDFLDKIEIVKTAEKENEDNLIKLFLDKFEENLSIKGFKYVDYKPVRNFYYLLFASKHKKGLEFWHKANKIDPYGQYTLDI